MSEGSPYRVAFVEALTKLGEVCALMKARQQPLPVLVGGAVVEFDTGSAIASGDFDLVAEDEDATAAALLAVGFRREDRQGRLLRGFYHPNLLIAVEMVGGGYFDGRADRRRVRVLDLGSVEILAAPTEDLIADRIGQWMANPADKTLLNQALTLIGLAESLDIPYLDRRISDETNGEFDVAAVWRLRA